ncbi:MAG: hypothetical protein Q9195_008558 [Heterodermia aff. obscurata]
MVSRQGLSELYVPLPGNPTTALSIVFVHGLFGHPHDTWTWEPPHDTWTEELLHRAKSLLRLERHNVPSNSLKTVGGDDDHGISSTDAGNTTVGNSSVFWPQDLLRVAIPDVRIYTWGYDADIKGLSTSSQNTIHQHARNLLSDLVDLRAESKDLQKPLIFVVHSLGGIIVKAAINLSRSTEGTKEKEIAPATAGICFLGTPHRGSLSATIGKILFQITKAAGKSPNTKILEGLERNSETLDMIGDVFNQTIIKYGLKMRIHSFREEKRTKKSFIRSTMVVGADSAKIGHGHEGIGSIPADHSNMTKFQGAEDVGFKRVSAKLSPWVTQLREEDEQQEDNDGA